MASPADYRRSLSVEKIESLSGINTGAGDLAFIRDYDGPCSRFSLMWRSDDGVMLTDVFDLHDYEIKYIQQYNLVELTPHKKEKKQINITFKDSESLKLFKANVIEDAMRKTSKSVSHADRKWRRDRTPTVHEDNLSTRLKPIPEKSMQGVMVPDLHVRRADLQSQPKIVVDQTDIDKGEVGNGCTDITSHKPLKSDEDRSSTGSDEPELEVDEEEAAYLNVRSQRRKNRRPERSDKTVIEETSRGIQDIRLEIDLTESSA